jgi:hypothetical protein
MAFSPNLPSHARSGLLLAAALVSMTLSACNAALWMEDGIPSHGTNSSTTIINGHVQMVVAWGESGDGYRLEWTGDGMPGVASGDADFEFLSDGDLMLAQYHGGARVAEVRLASEDGQVTRQFERDGVPVPYQPEGVVWMAEAVPTVIAQMGLGASTRVPRLYADGGLDAVLDDIALRETDMARTKYYEFVVESSDFSSAEVARSVQHASSRIDSDAHLAGVLEDAVDARPGDPVLVDGVLSASVSIDSDAHLAGLLEDIADLGGFGGETAPAFLAALSEVQSDAHAADVCEELVGEAGLAPATVALLLSRIGPQIDSDAHLADVLEELPRARLSDADVRRAFVEALATVQSDAHAADVLEEFVHTGDPAILADLIDAAAAGIGSDAHLADVLEEVPASALGEGRVRAAMRAAIDTIGSDAHRRSVLRSFPDDALSD